MKIIIAGEGFLKDTLPNGNLATWYQIIYIKDAADFTKHSEADAFIDLNFNGYFFHRWISLCL